MTKGGAGKPKGLAREVCLKESEARLIIALGSMGEEELESEGESGGPKVIIERVVEIRDSRAPDVSKWGAKFLGERTGSLNAFLERVEELRRARGVTEAQLFEAAAELFDSRALIWYRAICQRVNCWGELVRVL